MEAHALEIVIYIGKNFFFVTYRHSSIPHAIPLWCIRSKKFHSIALKMAQIAHVEQLQEFCLFLFKIHNILPSIVLMNLLPLTLIILEMLPILAMFVAGPGLSVAHS